MKHTIIWREIAERVYEIESDSFEEAIETLNNDWNNGTLPSEGASLFNEYICDETGDKYVEFNGYW